MVVMPGSTRLIGTYLGRRSTFTASDLYSAMLAGILGYYNVYTADTPDEYCSLSGISSVKDMNQSDYTFTATTESGEKIHLHAHGFVVDMRIDNHPRYTINHLPNANAIFGKYRGLKTTYQDRRIKDCVFDGKTESLYGLPFDMVLTSAYGLIVGSM